jgi:hypothetical protein
MNCRQFRIASETTYILANQSNILANQSSRLGNYSDRPFLVNISPIIQGGGAALIQINSIRDRHSTLTINNRLSRPHEPAVQSV